MTPQATRHILHHAALPHRGGAVRVARLLIQAQKAAGIDAQLSFEVAENDPEDLDATAPCAAPTAPGALAGRASRLPPDGAVHLHSSTDWIALLESLLDSNASLGLILTLHDATPLTGGCAYPLSCPHFPACADPCPRQFPQARLRQNHIQRLLERLAPRIVCPSGWLAGLARAALPAPLLAERPVRVIPNGVPWPEALTTRREARAALGLAPDAPLALFAAHGGTRAAYKSGAAWTLLWDRLRALAPGCQGLAVGGDELDGHNGLAIWPYLDRAKLALVMRAADCLVYPTLADNHPLVLLEAASLELPVASFEVGGVPEIVRHGETGLLAAPGDTTTLLANAARLLATPTLARTLGRAARDQGRKRFDSARMAAGYRKLLDE